MVFYPGQIVTASMLNSLAPLIAYKTADQLVTSSTTFVNDTQLAVPVEANSTYIGRLTSFWGGVAAGDAKTRFSFPTGTLRTAQVSLAATHSDVDTSGDLNIRMVTDASSPSTALVHSITTTNFVESLVDISLSTTNAGVLTLQWAQNASNGTATTHKLGSSLILWKVA